ncbi:MAG: hypothetical protein [Wendovervirus sonii]|uniref:Uncharacterized protein n=1 Tax=phage Lak_Megaphage_Sonny TaxID=3109229 RepID=A0ABZ0Z3P5_9CAUD|nr:MAG: hypothetical protein [phage Lak_Megaphage_Sonny]
MKYLYKKIYEAINTGIQKALVLDDEDDISMNYQHKKIVNNSNVIFYYVDNLLQNSDNVYNYGQIIKYYEETGYTYKVKNFQELRNIFDKIKYIKNASFEWISNMKDYISIVLEDKSEINFYEKTDKNSLFLRLANDDILGTENELLIYLHGDHCISFINYAWQKNAKKIQDTDYLKLEVATANKDYSGYETCLRIHNIASNDFKTYGETPAIDYCLKLNINGYQGYLPAMGQLKIISANIDIINYIFKYLHLNSIVLGESHWWSSTEYFQYNSWNLNIEHAYSEHTYCNAKCNKFRIFPLFAVKKN